MSKQQLIIFKRLWLSFLALIFFMMAKTEPIDAQQNPDHWLLSKLSLEGNDLKRSFLKYQPITAGTIFNPEAAKVNQFCFRGKPKPECNLFMIFEFGVTPKIYQNDSPSQDESQSFMWTYELGLMTNLNEKNALGGSLYAALDDNGSRFGLKSRYRRWLGRHFSLEVSPGILIGIKDNSYSARGAGFTGHVGLNIADLLIYTVQIEVIPYAGTIYQYPSFRTVKGNDVTWYSGLKLGSYAGVIGGVASLVVAIIAVSTIQIL